jgi:hypothetical protein
MLQAAAYGQAAVPLALWQSGFASPNNAGAVCQAAACCDVDCHYEEFCQSVSATLVQGAKNTAVLLNSARNSDRGLCQGLPYCIVD